MHRTILQQDDPRIHRVSNEIVTYNHKVRTDIAILKETLDDNKLSGIAAPQIGIPERIIIVRNKRILNNDNAAKETDFREILIINPKITKYAGTTTELYEGCGSVQHGNVFGLVCRPERVTVEYFDAQGKPQGLTTDGFLARVIQHEYDHLDGILFTEKIKRGTKLITKAEYLEIKEKEKLDQKA